VCGAVGGARPLRFPLFRLRVSHRPFEAVERGPPDVFCKRPNRKDCAPFQLRMCANPPSPTLASTPVKGHPPSLGITSRPLPKERRNFLRPPTCFPAFFFYLLPPPSLNNPTTNTPKPTRTEETKEREIKRGDLVGSRGSPRPPSFRAASYNQDGGASLQPHFAYLLYGCLLKLRVRRGVSRPANIKSELDWSPHHIPFRGLGPPAAEHIRPRSHCVHLPSSEPKPVRPLRTAARRKKRRTCWELAAPRRPPPRRRTGGASNRKKAVGPAPPPDRPR